YMPQTGRDAIKEALRRAGEAATADSPIAWLRMEPLDTRASHATLILTLWPGGDTPHPARCDYHGPRSEWTARARAPGRSAFRTLPGTDEIREPAECASHGGNVRRLGQDRLDFVRPFADQRDFQLAAGMEVERHRAHDLRECGARDGRARG